MQLGRRREKRPASCPTLRTQLPRPSSPGPSFLPGSQGPAPGAQLPDSFLPSYPGPSFLPSSPDPAPQGPASCLVPRAQLPAQLPARVLGPSSRGPAPCPASYPASCPVPGAQLPCPASCPAPRAQTPGAQLPGPSSRAQLPGWLQVEAPWQRQSPAALPGPTARASPSRTSRSLLGKARRWAAGPCQVGQRYLEPHPQAAPGSWGGSLRARPTVSSPGTQLLALQLPHSEP